MSTQEVFVQHFEKAFQHYRQALGPEQQASASWRLLPQEERDRLIAAARMAIMELEHDTPAFQHPRRYFAKPGEAEWGC